MNSEIESMIKEMKGIINSSKKKSFEKIEKSVEIKSEAISQNVNENLMKKFDKADIASKSMDNHEF